MRRRHLRAVFPVGLVSVVFRRIVAGRDLDARLRVEVADGERFLRHGTKGIGQIGPDAVGRQAERGLERKFRRHVPAVIRNRNASCRVADLVDVIGQSLGGLAYRIDVQTVRACSDDAAQTAGPEGKVRVKPFLDLFFIRFDGL